MDEDKLRKAIREEARNILVEEAKEWTVVMDFMEDVGRSYNVHPLGKKTIDGEPVYEFEIKGRIFQIKEL